MRSLLEQSFGPSSTPKVVQLIIGITTLTTLILALTEGLISYLTGFPGLASFLCLSYQGVTSGFLWQPLTYFFIYPTFGSGLTLSLIITLAFQMYLLWITGSALVERLGTHAFTTLYFAAGLLSGLVAIAAMGLSGTHTVIWGVTAPLLSILIVWTMLYPDTELMLLLTFPVKAAWLIFGYLVAILLIALSHLDIVTICFYLTSTVVGYLYATMRWGLQSPFPATHRVDDKLNRCGEWLVHRWERVRYSSSKIVPLHPEPEDRASDDEEFLDTMLTKISKYGEDSLSWRERHRLNRISKTKDRQNQK